MVKCPYCQSIFTRKFSALFEEQTGIKYSSGRFSGIGITEGGCSINQGKFKNKTLFYTSLAEKIAPPEPAQSYWLKIILLALLAIIVLSFMAKYLIASLELVNLLFWLIIFVTVYALYRDIKQFYQTKRNYPKKLRQWHNQYRCSQCGYTFTKE